MREVDNQILQDYMKKQILQVSIFACLTFLASFSAIAQTSGRVWSFGPEVGVTFFKHGMDDDFDADYKAGLAAGAFVTYSIKNTYALTAKILYSQKGMKTDQFDVEVAEKLSYIEIPVLARVFFNREGTVRPNVFLGPSFGFLTGSQWKIDDGDYENIEDSEMQEIFGDVDSYKDVYTTFDLGLSAGLGVNIRVANEMYLVIDARYTYGFSDIYKNTDGSSNNNQGVAVSAGLSFGIGN